MASAFTGDEARAVEWLRRNMRCGEHRREEGP